LFGFAGFRPGQRETIEAVLGGRDALTVMPTGGGKSLTYLLPGFLLPGLTVVVSPLISLMQDQVSKLEARRLPAAAVNSQIPWSRQREILDDVRAGRLKVLFVAPERFRNARFMTALAQAKVSLLAVDEAHCVSQWGHDFRPDYLRLREAAAACGRPPVLAVTATATQQVREDIVEQLGLHDDRLVLVRGFDRPNLHLAVHQVSGGRQAKLNLLVAALGQAPKGPGIVYCATRKNTETVAKALRKAGRTKVGVYHAGVPDERRRSVQERFFAGKVELVVATNAFGLGIDKQDLSFVMHHDLPGSLEAYYQEAGRAGRDGRDARCGLVFAPQDIHLQKYFIRSSHPERSLVREVARFAHRVGPDPARIERQLTTRASRKAIESALRLLDQADGRLEHVDFAAVEARAAHETALLEAMIGYAYGRGCRRSTILSYFGAPGGARCQNCDRCANAPQLQPAPSPGTRAAKGKATRKPRAARVQKAMPDPAQVDDELYAQLKLLRQQLAKRGRTKPFKIFHDRTLLEIAASKPTTRKALLAVHGIGDRKVSRYGDKVLEVVKTFA
jgi:ATP-dependent DNA helicase RecQ